MQREVTCELSDPVISIIVPVYNAERYIAETIQSVLRQSWHSWELILVDDCSEDHSAELIDGFMENAAVNSANDYAVREDAPAERIRLIRLTENAGAAGARNAGIDAARGQYIAFLDADDLWYPEKLERELHFMVEQDVSFAFTSYYFGDEDARPTGRIVHAPAELTFQKALTRTVIFTSTVMIDRRRVPEELIRMPEIKSEDTACWWTILKSGIVAEGLDEALTIYRRPEHSLSSNKAASVKRIWNLYRQIAGLNPVHALFCLSGWAIRAAARRV